jgi:hypothetical protein
VRSLLPRLMLAASALVAAPLWADTAASLLVVDHCLDTLSKNPVNTLALPPPDTLPAAVAPKTAAPNGIDRLRTLCPGLEQAINDAGVAEQLPENWQQSLNRNALLDISWLLHRYQSKPVSAAPRVPTLYQVARTLNQPQPRHSRWQDFKDWLRQLLLQRAPPGSSWLNRWWSQLTVPQSLLSLILYGLLAAVLVLAAWIVRRELQAARAGAIAARPDARRAVTPAAVAGASLPGLAELEHLPAREQPALLLRLLVQALLQSGRLRNERSLTHRELAARSAFDDQQQRGSFARLSLLAERLLYGAHLPKATTGPQPQIEQALADGRQLYAQLIATRAGAA